MPEAGMASAIDVATIAAAEVLVSIDPHRDHHGWQVKEFVRHGAHPAAGGRDDWPLSRGVQVPRRRRALRAELDQQLEARPVDQLVVGSSGRCARAQRSSPTRSSG